MAQPFEHQVACSSCYYPFPRGKDLGGAAVHHATQGEDDAVEGEVAGWAVAGLAVGDRVEILVDQPIWVGGLIWDLRGKGLLFVCQGDNCEIVFGIGQTRGLRPKQREYLDVVASADLVAEGFESDLGAGFPLEADLGLPEEVCPSAFGAVGLPSGSAKELRKVASNTRYGVNHETTSHDTESVTCLREMRTLEGRLGRSTLIKFG
ncbi:hypothetical protein EHS25_005729 [Saitozyma podzolica]|uniref:Uncharacterized protein n=1 Tax=Saitozyma podzolica TaxID=1890683 RepID=A0A427XVX2_9TREE|nr:hypothetical protein EHS25_005729 [Saitozyma podzolica]